MRRYYRNSHLVQKAEVEAEDGDLLAGVRNNAGQYQMLSSMLRECLLQRHYRQVSCSCRGSWTMPKREFNPQLPRYAQGQNDTPDKIFAIA